MRVLFVHNKYGVRSGEEIMLEKIIGLLRSRGHEVDTFFSDSSEVRGTPGKVRAAFSGLRSGSAIRNIRDQIGRTKPDLVQIQNLYPLISPAILPVVRQAGIPIIMRLSNYRLICPSGLFLSHGRVCESCRGGREWNCVLKNCESDLLKSAAYATRNAWARRRGYYSNNVTRYFAQTNFQREAIVREGYPASDIDVIPNMVDVPPVLPRTGPCAYVGFVGRLSSEKGVDTLIEAARTLPYVRFRFAGEPGPWAQRMDLPPNVELCGRLTGKELNHFFHNAAFIVVPSLWYEGFPSVMIEAMSLGRPLIVAGIGGLPEIIGGGKAGLIVPPGDVPKLANAIATLWNDSERRQILARNGFERVREEYSPDQYYHRLMLTYQKALA